MFPKVPYARNPTAPRALTTVIGVTGAPILNRLRDTTSQITEASFPQEQGFWEVVYTGPYICSSVTLPKILDRRNNAGHLYSETLPAVLAIGRKMAPLQETEIPSITHTLLKHEREGEGSQ